MIGFIGLGVMGENLIKNFASKGNSVLIFNRTIEKVDALLANNSGQKLFKANSVEELCAKLPVPRKIFLMVRAGQTVDHFLTELIPFLSKGDVIIDGGNSFFEDSIRRRDELAVHGISYVDIGISGGSEGALKGPSMMVGAEHEVYHKIQPILQSIAAQSPVPCVERLGPVGAGHFVKMVHNGIEYGLMQLIAESVFLIRKVGRHPLDDIGNIFSEYGRNRLNGFLIDATSQILSYKEDGEYLVDMLLDTATEKGTGRWTSLTAIKEGVSIPTIDAALGVRFLSGQKEHRVELSQLLDREYNLPYTKDIAEHVEKALLLAFVLTFDQGLKMLEKHSEINELKYRMSEILSIWRGGSILRMHLLDEIMVMDGESPKGILFSKKFQSIAEDSLQSLMKIVAIGASTGLPMPALSSSLQYFLGMSDELSSAQIIQALRDKFGAHGFKRLDRDGDFHSEWE